MLISGMGGTPALFICLLTGTLQEDALFPSHRLEFQCDLDKMVL